MSLEEEIRQLTVDYYKNYYSGQLSLPDWEVRVKSRLDELNGFSKKVVDTAELLLNVRFSASQKILIVGTGTGGEFIILSKKGCEVYGIEPFADANRIASLNARKEGLKENRIIAAVGENIPFHDDSFDYIITHTVIEHTQNPRECLKEMVRVIKPGGRIYLTSIDYRSFYEGHYKINFPFPMTVPKLFLKLYLRLLGRNPHFIDTLSFVSADSIRKVLKELPVYGLKAYYPYTDEYVKPAGIIMSLRYWFDRFFDIQTNQYWIIIKRHR